MQFHPQSSRAGLCLLAAALLASPADVVADGLTAAEQAAGWTVLFDGTSTDAWRGYRKAAFPEQGWVIEDGALKVEAGGGGGDLITKQLFRNFELTMEWRVAEGANSGVMYRVTEEFGAPWQTGPEMQILDDTGYNKTADDAQSAGALYDLYAPPADKVTKPVGEYNHARIVLRDGIVKQYLNGVKTSEADLNGEDWAARVKASKFSVYDGFGVREVGHLCLQDHGNDVWFRNIRVRDLDAPLPGEIDLLAGNRLTQWTAHLKDDGAMDDVWSFDGDVLRCAGQPVGYIRTNATYTNYVLRLQWRFEPGNAGNSGVLLRMIGEDKVWPKSVEAQLQSGAAGDFWNIDTFTMSVDPDRTNGRNTKRLFTNERPVGAWNDYEIIVDGGNVALIVNDELVNTAWDVEEIAGWICLQSEGKPIQFRNVRLAEIR